MNLPVVLLTLRNRHDSNTDEKSMREQIQKMTR
jgi:DNA primase large subunit